MLIKIILLAVLVVIVSSILMIKTFKEDSTFKRRKKQSSMMLKENIIRKRLEKIIGERVKVSRRMKVEKLCIQAGYNLKYHDYLIISLLSSLLFSSIFRYVFSNAYLGFIFLVVGLFIPHQVLLFKRNKRLEKMNSQIGPCLKMIIERYKVSKDMKSAVMDTVLEFKGEDPIYKELSKLAIEIELGKGLSSALEEFADRTGNPYMLRFVDYYKICVEVGTVEVRDMLNQALYQYQEDRRNKLLLKKEISSVKSQAYIVLAGVPGVALYQSIMDPGYISFMTGTFVGQVGTAAIVTVTLAAFWIINKKIGAPIE